MPEPGLPPAFETTAEENNSSAASVSLPFAVNESATHTIRRKGEEPYGALHDSKDVLGSADGD